MRLAVIIPVLNGMPYLPETLASLEAQSHKNFEVILWDNGSTDGTVEEAARWIPSRIPGRIVPDEPLPLHACLARMVELTEAEFIARMDADDLCEPHRFETQLEEFARDAELAVLGGQARYIDPAGRETGEDSAFPCSFAGILAGMLVENQLLHPTVMFRRTAVLAAGNYAVEKPCEDYDLWMKTSRHGTIRNLPVNLIRYRIHPTSVIATARRQGRLEAPNRKCIEDNCEAIFGLSRRTYSRLREKSGLFAAGSLLRAALRIASDSSTRLTAVIMSPEFIWSARCLTGHRDLLSRAFWSLCERGGQWMGRA